MAPPLLLRPVSLLFALFFTGSASAAEVSARGTIETVGRVGENRYYTPANQMLTPAGIQVDLPGLRPQAIALSPDGRLLVTSGKTAEIVVLAPASGKILQRVPFPATPRITGEKNLSDKPAISPTAQLEEKSGEPLGTQIKPDTGAQLSFTGLVFSPDGARVYVSNVNGDIKVFSVDRERGVAPLTTLPLPEVRGKRKADIPSGISVSEDGKRLYVALNLGNRLAEIDAANGELLRMWDVGVAPYDVALAGGKVYVSNWGGRRPGRGDITGPAGRGTVVRVDSVRGIASEGSVSVIDLKTASVTTEILTGLHASALAVSPNQRYVIAANAGSDTISVIEVKSDRLIENILVRDTPADLFSATPDAVAFDKTGKRIFVCNATQNAVGIVRFEPIEHDSKLVGSIPVGWFPGGVVFEPTTKSICVANIKGLGSHRVGKVTDKPGKPSETGQNSKDYFGLLSIVPLPDEKGLAEYSRAVALNMRQGLVEAAKMPPRQDQPPRVVPERSGEPSPIKHVIYIIKENRTYDQILGDVPRGKGAPALCTFGAKITPNQHKLVDEFVLLDNAYCSGVQSADGHQWTDSAITTDYVEREHAGWPRSYPNLKTGDAMDALAYSPAGFLWDNCLAHGVSIRNFGEACVSDCAWTDKNKKGKPSWRDFYLDFVAGTHQTRLHSKVGISALGAISELDTVGWDLNIPDVCRAARFIGALRQWEADGAMPQLIVMTLPNDHTGGTAPGHPTPAAQVADNDLALGQIVEALSHGKYWSDTVLFALEDDPQNGWDHISGYRSTVYVASGYARRNTVVSTQYNTTSVIRTIELMLGLPPMNIMDASATPMSDCFAEAPNLAPFDAVPAQQPLDELGAEPKKIANPQLRKDAVVSSKLPLAEADRCPEDVLNRILWRAMKGTHIPYPAWAVDKTADID